VWGQDTIVLYQERFYPLPDLWRSWASLWRPTSYVPFSLWKKTRELSPEQLWAGLLGKVCLCVNPDLLKWPCCPGAGEEVKITCNLMLQPPETNRAVDKANKHHSLFLYLNQLSPKREKEARNRLLNTNPETG
jgi:hypothetical protein